MDQDKRFSNVLGDEYDLSVMSYPHHNEFQRAIGEVIQKKFANSALGEIRILEIGCGTGITTKILLECDPRTWVTAIDNEPKMIPQVEANIRAWGMEKRAKAVQADIMGYLERSPNESFDVVASGFTIHNFEKNSRDKLIRRIYQVLRHGGLFVNGDKYAQDDPGIHQETLQKQRARYDVYEAIGRPDYKQAMIEHMERDEKDDLIFKEGAAKQLMKQAGFQEITTDYRKDMEAVISAVKK